MANFNSYIDTIDMEFWHNLCVKEGVLRHYSKGEFFLRAGEVPKYFGFIESGYFKYSVVDSQGNERITGFALCNNIAGDFYSSIHRVTALNNLIATTHSAVWVISTARVKEVLNEYPDLYRIIADELFRMSHERYINLYRQSPKERYIELINKCSDILRQITLKEMASYLQITPTHLSRLRKEFITRNQSFSPSS